MRAAIVVAVACLSAAGLCAGQDVQASIKKSTNIPAQELVPALKTLAHERGFHVVFLAEVVGNRRTHGAVGELTTTEALSRLLKGTNLKYSYLDGKTVTIVPVDSNSKLGGQESPAENLPRCSRLSSDKLDSVTSLNQTGSEGTPDCVENYSFDNQVLATRIASAEDASVQNSDGGSKSNKDSTGDALQLQKEVIVTGTYIPQASSSGSPVDVVDRAQIERAGIGGNATDFLRSVPENFGASNAADQGNAGFYNGAGFVDIRELGAASTLVLLDGLRQTRYPLDGTGAVDVNSLMPTIAIKRVEILKDGASATYGADAIGGVVNFISRDDFTGVELRTNYQRDTTIDRDREVTVGAIFGSDVSERIHLTGAFEFAQSGGIYAADFKVANQQDITTNGIPIAWPGNYTVPLRNAAGQLTGQTELVADPLGAQIAAAGSRYNPPGWGPETYFANGLLYDPDQWLAKEAPLKRWIGRTAVRVKLTDSTVFNGTFSTAYSQTTTLWPETNVVFTGLTVPGANPGNPFRAVNSLGQPLYALPNPSNPTAPLLDANGNAVLSSRPTDPTSGVPFNENVIASLIQPLTATNNPYINNSNDMITVRTTGVLKTEFNDRWSGSLSGVYARQRAEYSPSDTNVVSFQAYLEGHGGACGCKFWNPFGNSLYAAPGSPQYNDPADRQDFGVRLQDYYDTSLASLDGTVVGQLWDLPAGPVAVAFGGQVRHETLSQSFDNVQKASENEIFDVGSQDFSAGSTSVAAYTEVQAPVFDSEIGKLNVSAAGRYEKERNSGLSTVDPKISFLYKYRSIGLRGSFATSFLVPSLFQRYGIVDGGAGAAHLNDPVTGGPAYPIVRFGGSLDAKPQKAKSYNIGIPIEIDSRLTATVDYWRLDYRDLLAQLGAQQVIDQVAAGQLPSDLVVRDPVTHQITLVNSSYYNVGALKTSGLDLALNYTAPAIPLGTFAIFGSATRVLTYEAQQNSTSPVIDSVGLAYSAEESIVGNTGVPKWKSNIGVGWSLGDHSANIVARYISGLTYVDTGDAVDQQLYVDAQYSYEATPLGLCFTLGATNIFNKIPNVIPETGIQYFNTPIQLPIPRRIYVNVRYDFE